MKAATGGWTRKDWTILTDAVAIVAGDGRLPLEAARRARETGRRVVVVAVGQRPEEGLEEAADLYAHIPVYRLAEVLDFLVKAQVKTVYMLGKVKKGVVFFSTPDREAQALLDSLPERNDDALLQGAVNRLHACGMEVRPQAELLDHLLVGPGYGTRHAPRRPEDVWQGLRVARALAGLDIGQTVVVKDGVVVAVEATDGTDPTIRRGGTIAGPGTTVVKVAKPQQDLRFDMPTVGLRTLEQMIAVGAQTLALEAGKAFIVDRDRFLREADAAGIAVWGVGEGEGPSPAGDRGRKQGTS